MGKQTVVAESYAHPRGNKHGGKEANNDWINAEVDKINGRSNNGSKKSNHEESRGKPVHAIKWYVREHVYQISKLKIEP